MRSFPPARRTGTHVQPALLPARRTLSVGLTALLLPLSLASPALADATPAPVPHTAAIPTSSPAEQAKRQTELRISGPSGTVSPGSHTVAVRLLADGRPVRDAHVRLERRTASGWEHAGRLLTRSDGLGAGKLHVARSTRLRATYAGSATRTAATSREVAVTVADFRARAVQVAAQQEGKPYRWGSTGPDSFDCSGLMVYVFRQVGKSLPRTSSAQLDATQRIARSAKQPGDLIFTQRNGRVGHVGVYAGDGKFWVAPKAGDVVKLQTIYTSSYLVGRVR